jgi:hypothetical protein
MARFTPPKKYTQEFGDMKKLDMAFITQKNTLKFMNDS